MANRAGPHTALCKAIEEYILWNGGYIVKNIGGLGVRRGRPDFDACLKGRALFIEVKTGGGTMDSDQVRERNRIVQAGGIHIEAHSVEEVEDTLLPLGLVTQRLFR